MIYPDKITEIIRDKIKKDRSFNVLTQEEFTTLFQGVSIVHYSKGDRIIRQEDKITYALYLVSGYVKVSKSVNNNSVILDLVGAHSFINLPWFISNNNIRLTITALSDVHLCMFDIQLIRSICISNPLFCMEQLKLSADHCDAFSERYVNLITKNIYGRIAYALVYLSEHIFKNLNFNILLSREELSDLMGISRGNIIRVLTEMSNDKIIQIKGKEITILKPDLLKQIITKGHLIPDSNN